MAALPTGTLTLLFTDIEGSTRLLQRLGGADYARLLAAHHRLLREAVIANHGTEVKTEGDSFFVVFERADEAVAAAVQAQRGLAAEEWPAGAMVAVRMGLHTGELALSAGEYVGLDIHRAARISDAGHGGQVLLSGATAALITHELPSGVSLRDMGEHGLKDLDAPEHIYQLVIDGLAVDFPPIRAVSTRIELLPPETTTFVGRERELTRIRQLLTGTRLLTLTGTGGTGKTRLALQLARDVAAEYADGVAFVPLAAIDSPELVASTIRQTLGLAEQPGKSAAEVLAEYLHERQFLLVLDNFEQVLAAAPVIGRLIGRTTKVAILVTSRARLQLTGEQEFSVPPLELPGLDQAGDLQVLSQSEAVALFMQRARAMLPDFDLTAANARAIVEICTRLDGLPLAIELAAARIKLLPPQALLARLEHRLDILQSSTADRTDRQRTLRGTIDWSYELLGQPEQALFRRMSIFVGGWSFESAEALAMAADAPAVDTLDGLTALVDHSLVRQEAVAGEPRFMLLETIREYGREQLAEAGELEPSAALHAAHFAGLAERAEPHLTSGAEWLDRLELEHDNLRAMLRWASDNDIQQGLRCAGQLWRFWHLRGHLREGSALLRDMLDRPAAAVPTPARAKALVGLAGLVYWMQDYAAARTAYESALPIARDNGLRDLEAEILYSLAYVRGTSHEWGPSVRAYLRARKLYSELGATSGVAWSDFGVGMIYGLRGKHDESLPIVAEALARFEELGDEFGMRNAQAVLTRALTSLGRLAEARVYNSQNITAAHTGRDPTSLSAALLDLATIEAMSADPRRAARLYGAAQTIVERTGGQTPPELLNRIEPLPLIRQQLDAAELDALVAEGRALSTDEAVALALAETPAAP